MGCIQSDFMRHNKLARQRSQQIDQELSRDHQRHGAEVKLLLLGAGESGKSTIVKQIKLIHESHFTEEERLEYIPVVHNNTIQSLVAIINGMNKLNIGLSDPDRINDVQYFVECVVETEKKFGNYPPITVALGRAMQSLWNDKGVRKCFLRANEYQLNDSAGYFLNSLQRISAPGYIPNQQDVLRTRVKTTGIVETKFRYRGLSFKLFDVGGQQSERKKWINCFDNVTAIIFCVALSDYDLSLYEDESINRMHESLKLFSSICNNELFRDTSIILFLNKNDIFAEKIRRSSLKKAFPEYTGKDNYEEASAYIRRKFESLHPGRGYGRSIYTHFTCATSDESMEFVFDSVTEVILRNNMKQNHYIER